MILKNQLPNAFSISSEPLNVHISYQLELYYVIHRGVKQPFEKLSDEVWRAQILSVLRFLENGPIAELFLLLFALSFSLPTRLTLALVAAARLAINPVLAEALYIQIWCYLSHSLLYLCQHAQSLSRKKEDLQLMICRTVACRGVVVGGGFAPDLTSPPKILTAPPYHHMLIYIYVSYPIIHFSLLPR